MRFGQEHLEEGPVEIRDFPDLLKAEGVTWINLDGLHDVEIIRELGEAADLHPLTLEDLVSTGQRPKVEEYESYLFMTLRMLTLKGDTTIVESEQVSIILGPEWVLSFQERVGDVWARVRDRVRLPGTRLRQRNPDYLAYALLDSVVDHYFHLLERLGDAAEALEMEVLDSPSEDAMRRIHTLKQEMLVIRRAVWPLREMMSQLTRSETPLIRPETEVFLRDVYDHTIQVLDAVEVLRDLVSGLQELYMSAMGHRMNEIMKVLTVMASIFIPLTFLAGIYGMNFQNMPELGFRWGYPVLLGVMVVLGIGMLAYFRRKDWL
jgi:magnesium transporter